LSSRLHVLYAHFEQDLNFRKEKKENIVVLFGVCAENLKVFVRSAAIYNNNPVV
jgi:hypothetical protein